MRPVTSRTATRRWSGPPVAPMPTPPPEGPRTIARLRNGEFVRALGNGTTGVHMRPVVDIVDGGPDHGAQVFVRDYGWRRYTIDDGASSARLDGFGRGRTP